MDRKIYILQRIFSWGDTSLPVDAFESFERASTSVYPKVFSRDYGSSKAVWKTEKESFPQYVLTEVDLIGDDNT